MSPRIWWCKCMQWEPTPPAPARTRPPVSSPRALRASKWGSGCISCRSPQRVASIRRTGVSSSKPIMPHCNAVVFSTRFQCFKTNADHTAMNMAKYGSTAALGLFEVTRSCQGKKQIQINRIQKKVTGNIKAKAITIACNAYPEHSAHGWWNEQPGGIKSQPWEIQPDLLAQVVPHRIQWLLPRRRK